MRLRRDKRGDAVGRSGRESSLSGVPGAKFFCEKPGIGTKMKNSLNFVSTVSKSLTRAVACNGKKLHAEAWFQRPRPITPKNRRVATATAPITIKTQ